MSTMERGAAVRGTLPEEQVRAMFDRIAGVYDLMNSVMTVGMHHRWRQRTVELSRAGPGDRVLDVATGTGDLALALAERVGPTGEVVGCDFSEPMLALARQKAPAVRFERANALELPYPDGSFAATLVGFGARNFADLERSVAEMARVTRAGGSFGFGSIASSRPSVASRATATPTVTSRARSAGFRGPTNWLPYLPAWGW
jgi:demethylmenaquinone methyltransferase / 2-methoxy-6-polyprenyl-1,4-benzoquinol methylase